ncbi:cell envelope integrity protein TolA, partial [Salmonella enterica subsp. enterica serovar Paratyphi A]
TFKSAPGRFVAHPQSPGYLCSWELTRLLPLITRIILSIAGLLFYRAGYTVQGDLSSGKNAPKTGGGAKGNGQPSKDSGTSGANGGTAGADISAYAKQIQVAIQSRLYDASLYQGKQCVLHISLAPDGSLKSITSEGGDPALCQAALMAAKTAKIPKPPSQAVYEKIKDAKLDFKL